MTNEELHRAFMQYKTEAVQLGRVPNLEDFEQWHRAYELDRYEEWAARRGPRVGLRRAVRTLRSKGR